MDGVSIQQPDVELARASFPNAHYRTPWPAAGYPRAIRAEAQLAEPFSDGQPSWFVRRRKLLNRNGSISLGDGDLFPVRTKSGDLPGNIEHHRPATSHVPHAPVDLLPAVECVVLPAHNSRAQVAAPRVKLQAPEGCQRGVPLFDWDEFNFPPVNEAADAHTAVGFVCVQLQAAVKCHPFPNPTRRHR